jgi:hypothetical protein
MLVFLVILNFMFFCLGNYIYTLEIPLMVKIAVSELSFICFYTFCDKGNFKYKLIFPIIMIITVAQCVLPFYDILFYSTNVKYMSLLISSIAIIINYVLANNLLHGKFKNIMLSRISTAFASIFEISVFSYLLDIGLEGALITVLTRFVYIIIITKLVFK